ncbi:MAG: hypothetical protein JXB09_05850, partial [Deltaproteobacteria bacterium]|nr:hypothetical protein [Deltaproteobacteria bacterium]
IKLVSAAVSVSAYGEDPEKVSGVRVERAIEQSRKELVPSTFFLARHKILEYGQSTEFHQSMTLSGSLDFQDALGRRTILFYNATYRVESKGVVISRCGVMPVFPDDPAVIAFTVPGKKMPQDTRKIFHSFEKLYRFASDNAIPMGKPERLSGEDNMYYIFTFILDRISPTSNITFMVDDTKTKSRGYSDASRYYDYDGWRVAVLPGTFKLLDEKPLYFKLSYRPGKDQPITRQYERQVAMFGTFDRETLRKAQNRPDLSILLPFEDAIAPIDPKLKNRWQSTVVRYPEVSSSAGILKSMSDILNKKEKSSEPEQVIPYTYTINSRGSLLVISADSKKGTLWLSFFPAERMITDVPLELRVGNSTPIDLQQYLVGPQGTDLTRYRHLGNVVHYRLYAGIQAPFDETLLTRLMKGSQVKIKYSTQSQVVEDTFFLKNSSDAIKAVLNGYAG